MEARTFDQLFKLRPNCPCGAPLFTLVQPGNVVDDDYTFSSSVGAYHETDGEEYVSFLIRLDSTAYPYGQAEFKITCPTNSSNFELLAAYAPESPRNGLTAEKFVKKHFTYGIQFKQKIRLKRECENKGNCSCNYTLTTDPITFDIDSQRLNIENLCFESFDLIDSNKRKFFFKTDFINKTTSVHFISPSSTYVIGKMDSFELDSEKFLRYPLDREFLLNKVKTFLLFS